MKLLIMKIDSGQFSKIILIIEAQVATVNTCRHLYRLKNSACPATFAWGRLFDIYLTKNFHREGKTESFALYQRLYETSDHLEIMSSLTRNLAFL